MNIFLFLLLVVYTTGEIVETDLGSLRGFERKSRDKHTYYGFLGVPYAKPPVRNLRFKEPKPAKKWSGILDATKHPSHCLQNPVYIKNIRNETLGHEDCLYMNIFTPEFKSKMPVMFYLHGGSFRTGFPGPFEMADFLMDEKIVLVAPQYRLGVLGFLSTEDTVIPGNFGLKDQALALAWVKKYIHSFGGDPKKITVFGYGAGGLSANLLMKSPLTKKMIKYAISESGVDNKIWGVERKKGRAKRMAEKTGRVLGCKLKSKDLLKCLQNADEKDIVQSELQNLYWDYESTSLFRPVIEKKDEKTEKKSFLTKDPDKIDSKIPWIVGVTSGEGNFKVASLVSQDQAVTDEFHQHLDDYIAKMLGEEDVTDKVRKTVVKIKKKYFKKITNLDQLLSGIKNFYGDLNFYWPVQNQIKKHRGKVYYYVFDYRGGQSMSDIFGVKSDLGVNHADETFLIFNRTSFTSGYNKPGDKKISKEIVKMWANFAKKGKPRDEKPKWMPIETSEYLHITEKFKMEKNFKKGVQEFWESLPLYKKKSKD